MKSPSLSIILPVYNEAESLPILMQEINAACRRIPHEVIVVDDGSTDASCAFATIRLPRQQGKWAALRAGISAARGTIVITMDADLQDDPREIPNLLGPLKKGYDIVSGERYNRQDPLYKIVLTRLANRIFGFRDFASPFKAYTTHALAQLPKEGSFLRYSFLFARQLGLRATEVPVHHRARRYGESKFGVVKYFRILYDLILIRLLFLGSSRI